MLIVLVVISLLHSTKSTCLPSVTEILTSRGSSFCVGDLIFEDNFNTLNLSVWSFLDRQDNYFSEYVNTSRVAFVRDGILFLKPTLNPDFEIKNDSRKVTSSARISTRTSFAFVFGKVEVRAKVPSGDWTFPAIWLIPKAFYGVWPMSGEIDIMESRGNRKLFKNHKNIGSEQVESTLHFGPDDKHDNWRSAHKAVNTAADQGFDRDFHRYQMTWTLTGIRFGVDDQDHLNVEAGEGFWKRGGYDKIKPALRNPWINGTIMAPFDKWFYLCLNVAVGGFSFFPDDAINENGRKPWKNSEDHYQGMAAFYNARKQWLSTWKNESSAMQVDYVRVWAV